MNNVIPTYLSENISTLYAAIDYLQCNGFCTAEVTKALLSLEQKIRDKGYTPRW